MAMTDTELAEIRDEVGAEPDDETLDGFFDQLGAATLVSLRVLRRRRGDLLGQPKSFTLTGVLSVTSGEIDALDAHIRRLEARASALGLDDAGASGGLTVTHLSRTPTMR
jgi:hypothetical protein